MGTNIYIFFKKQLILIEKRRNMKLFCYFCSMKANIPTYDEARKAIRDGKDPMAFMHLGIIYANGMGIIQNHDLACYFFNKAIDLGCLEAEAYLAMEYESGAKDFADDIDAAVRDPRWLTKETISKLRKRIEKERIAGNYGNLSLIRSNIMYFYPEYNKEKAISDILSGRNTVGAGILYSLSTSSNHSEKHIKSQESLLEQLYAPITKEKSLCRGIGTDLLSQDGWELAQCLVNLTNSYDSICQSYDVDRKELYTLDSLDLYPYIKIPTLVELRKQAFRCLLSIKDLEPVIRDKYLECLDNYEKMLNCSEEIEDEDIQLFLISFVELNIDIEALEITSLSLLHAYRNNDLQPLINHLNDFVNRLTVSGIKHSFPVFTADNLPLIEL